MSTNGMPARMPAGHSAARPLADDILRGADQIAEFMLGDDTPRNRRKIYHLNERGAIPTFRLGTILCARRSVLLDWIAAQESHTAPPAGRRTTQ